MAIYWVEGISGGTDLTADQAIFSIWNPHSARLIRLMQLSAYKTGDGAAITLGYTHVIRRISTRGTVSSAVIPDADNSDEADDAPPSGFVMDLNFTAEPTLASPVFRTGMVFDTPPGNGWVVPFWKDPVVIPPGTGIAVTQVTADTAGSYECGAAVDD